PRFPLRPRRPRLQRRAGADEHDGAAVHLPLRDPPADRRRPGRRGMNAVVKGLIGLRDWVDDRFPLMQWWNDHMGQYYAPKNFNIWYIFGVLSLVVFAIQIITGIWLVMSYKPDANLAFASVEYIMRDVDWGWLIRYLHSTGASAFFIVVYLHMFRALLYGSYKQPRELIWILGMF